MIHTEEGQWFFQNAGY